MTAVYFVEAADREFHGAVAWYDQQDDGPGHRFGVAVAETVRRVAAHPLASTTDAEGFRRGFVKGFPYKLISWRNRTSGSSLPLTDTVGRGIGNLGHRI